MVVDTEFSEINGFDHKYLIGNSGTVISPEFTQFMKRNNCQRTIKKKTLKNRLNKKGYVVVSLKKGGKSKSVKVHRLVAAAFVVNPMGKPQVNHKDLVKSNNHYSNLEWVTNYENRQHAIDNGVYIGRPKNK